MIKAYEDMNFIQKIIYKIRLRKLLKKVSMDQLKIHINSMRLLEELPREDKNYNEYIKECFNA